jgi:thiamine transporter 2/3
VDKSLYFHSEDSKDRPFTEKIVSAFKLMKSHFVDAYTNLHVVKWSAWWALSTCGYVQIENYMQPLYSAIQESNEAAYNGAVEAILTLSGFLVALLAGYLRFNWEVKGEVTLGIFSLIQGVLIVVISQTEYIFLCYAFYIVYGILYHFMVTIASAQIAKAIDEDSYGLIFGINTFFSLVSNSILTALVATEGIGFALDPRDQYIVYGSYHLGISLIFIVIGLRTCIVSRRATGESTDDIVNVEHS